MGRSIEEFIYIPTDVLYRISSLKSTEKNVALPKKLKSKTTIPSAFAVVERVKQ